MPGAYPPRLVNLVQKGVHLEYPGSRPDQVLLLVLLGEADVQDCQNDDL
jgi:hypothetical protein